MCIWQHEWISETQCWANKGGNRKRIFMIPPNPEIQVKFWWTETLLKFHCGSLLFNTLGLKDQWTQLTQIPEPHPQWRGLRVCMFNHLSQRCMHTHRDAQRHPRITHWHTQAGTQTYKHRWFWHRLSHNHTGFNSLEIHWFYRILR